jgi:hypothetical protein
MNTCTYAKRVVLGSYKLNNAQITPGIIPGSCLGLSRGMANALWTTVFQQCISVFIVYFGEYSACGSAKWSRLAKGRA